LRRVPPRALELGRPVYYGSVGDGALRSSASAASHEILDAFRALSPPACYLGESSRIRALLRAHVVRQARPLLRAGLDAGVQALRVLVACATYGDPAAVPHSPTTHSHSPVTPTAGQAVSSSACCAATTRLRLPVLSPSLLQLRRRHRRSRGEQPRARDSHHPLVLDVAAGPAPTDRLRRRLHHPHGTAWRDSIHVEDLGAAHLLALWTACGAGGLSELCNLAPNRLLVLEVNRDPRAAGPGARSPPERPGAARLPPRLVANATRAPRAKKNKTKNTKGKTRLDSKARDLAAHRRAMELAPSHPR